MQMEGESKGELQRRSRDERTEREGGRYREERAIRWRGTRRVVLGSWRVAIICMSEVGGGLQSVTRSERAKRGDVGT